MKQKRRPGQDARQEDGGLLEGLPAWKLEEAKARFSELVRRTRAEGPQRVTCRGKDAVVVISAEEFQRLGAVGRTSSGLVHFLQGTALGEVEPTREEDRGRDVPF